MTFEKINSRRLTKEKVKVDEYFDPVSGLRHIHITPIAPKDLVKMSLGFKIDFKTPTLNTKGTAHVLEHMCMCSNKKYPSKRSFFDLSDNTLAQSLNAETREDRTSYYAVTDSENKKDFANLFDFYLHAVFTPNLTSEDFLQEAWRYEFKDNDPSNPLEINGVVFNEMKGKGHVKYKYSLPSIEAQKDFSSKPIYSYNFGGDPEFISQLSHEEIISYYKEHYTSDKCTIYTAGDLDITEIQNKVKETLSFRNTFDVYPKTNLDSPIFKDNNSSCLINEEAEPDRKYFIPAPDFFHKELPTIIKDKELKVNVLFPIDELKDLNATDLKEKYKNIVNIILEYMKISNTNLDDDVKRKKDKNEDPTRTVSKIIKKMFDCRVDFLPQYQGGHYFIMMSLIFPDSKISKQEVEDKVEQVVKYFNTDFQTLDLTACDKNCKKFWLKMRGERKLKEVLNTKSIIEYVSSCVANKYFSNTPKDNLYETLASPSLVQDIKNILNLDTSKKYIYTTRFDPELLEKETLKETQRLAEIRESLTEKEIHSIIKNSKKINYLKNKELEQPQVFSLDKNDIPNKEKTNIALPVINKNNIVFYDDNSNESKVEFLYPSKDYPKNYNIDPCIDKKTYANSISATFHALLHEEISENKSLAKVDVSFCVDPLVDYRENLDCDKGSMYFWCNLNKISFTTKDKNITPTISDVLNIFVNFSAKEKKEKIKKRLQSLLNYSEESTLLNNKLADKENYYLLDTIQSYKYADESEHVRPSKREQEQHELYKYVLSSEQTLNEYIKQVDKLKTQKLNLLRSQTPVLHLQASKGAMKKTVLNYSKTLSYYGIPSQNKNFNSTTKLKDIFSPILTVASDNEIHKDYKDRLSKSLGNRCLGVENLETMTNKVDRYFRLKTLSAKNIASHKVCMNLIKTFLHNNVREGMGAYSVFVDGDSQHLSLHVDRVNKTQEVLNYFDIVLKDIANQNYTPQQFNAAVTKELKNYFVVDDSIQGKINTHVLLENTNLGDLKEKLYNYTQQLTPSDITNFINNYLLKCEKLDVLEAPSQVIKALPSNWEIISKKPEQKSTPSPK